jgi:CDP-diacylglycerol--glycerol-3-phosphate 3-phosphatidyltransferase
MLKVRRKMRFNLATNLTIFRMLVVPIVCLGYLTPFSWSHNIASVLFIIGAVTDWLDGYIARNFNQTSIFGAFLDPIADKLMVASVLVVLVYQLNTLWMVWPALIIISREIIISALREWMAEIGHRASIAVGWIGKVKTILQLVALGFLIWYQPEGKGFAIGMHSWVYYVGAVLLYISVALTLWSMLVYLKIAWPDLTLSKE